jgi:transcriptional regulator of acetoin/glycerol metabolism
MRRYRLTLDVALDAATLAEARRVLADDLHDALALTAEAGSAAPRVLDALAEALTGRALADGTPILAELDTVDRLVVIERRAIVRALHATGGHLATAAARLGLARNTLYKRVRQYDVDLASVRAEKGRLA